MNVRNRLYDKGVFDSFDLGARTISVGNITTGGTGKTPLVAYIANLLAERGETVCILTRGYGRREPKKRVLVSDGKEILASADDAGDEPFELATKLLGKAIIVADADRVSAGEWAKREFGVTRFVLDDGFQHRRVKRDVDIVCVDATKPFGGGKMLPSGRLREPLENLVRADAIVITRADLADDIEELKEQISRFAPASKIFSVQNRARIVDLRKASAAITKDSAVWPFCGLGNPDAFFRQVELYGVKSSGSRTFPDHHRYTQADIDGLQATAKESGAEILLTTAKDAVKLSGLKVDMPCYVLEIDVEIDKPEVFAEMF